MNSLVRVFSNFKDFYSEINGATLTGAIDVIVVEQPDGEFLCSPFHVRFGKLGVLRSREKIVDIEINGEPVDIHMKLGESGEAFFVEECPEEEIEELPDNLATSPLPSNDFTSLDDVKTLSTTSDIPLPMPMPRRNSIDLSKDCNEDKKDLLSLENQVSDYKTRRHTDNTLERRELSAKLKEFTTQKLRQEWAEHEEQLFPTEVGGDVVKESDTKIIIHSSAEDKGIDENELTDLANNNKFNKIENKNNTKEKQIRDANKTSSEPIAIEQNNKTQYQQYAKDESKSKKKRRKKSQMKKKNSQRKESLSSSVENTVSPIIANPINTQPVEIEIEPDATSNNTSGSSNDESSSRNEEASNKSSELKTATGNDVTMMDSLTISNTTTTSITADNKLNSPNRLRELDIHFFSDTEVGNSNFSPRDSRPSSPIQSDTEFEISQQREKDKENSIPQNASWKWGELPQTQTNEQKDEQQSQRNSMLSGMFSFMKKTNKIRKCSTDGGVYLSEIDAESMDPEMAALYFPSINKNLSMNTNEDDQESGNGTSLPHSPSSMEGPKSLDSDYDEGKPLDNKYIDFVALSDCGGIEKGGPTDEEFNRNLVKYSDVCQNPSLFSSPNLVVRLNGKYYNWTAACPIIMTIITFKKALPNDVIEQLMNIPKNNIDEKIDQAMSETTTQETKRGYSWWYWRRSGAGVDKPPTLKDDEHNIKNEVDLNAVGTQTSRTNSPDENKSTNILSTSENSDLLRTYNTSIDSIKGEKYKKSLRLSSDAIKQLNLKPGVNEIEFSVTTAYQGTSRCKCYLFRWKHNDKVVISDIDGTITKSDVLGHILPMVGKDWAQIGVAQLFSKIEENGYKLLYLSARAIGQSRVTREYLRSIRQGDVQLPDGPLLLNPTSLISAFHREVIERKPEQFKIACLSDIQALFPDKNPFYAGYGNRINDVWAYRAVGIPIMRIFTINTKGELKHELTQTFQSSYTGQTIVVNEIFPPINIYSDDEADGDYYRDDEDELQFHHSETENDDTD
ncbi:phosphatidate phosphatase LPIN3 isoform X2 [Condylostylus longicornis]|uniref:phosphatidate phosphatase LPIN3 isoform X2 n=1 Tax=Condylostylus longicornis TaxID=2530218 RepID=UPI00244E43FA|nr:phosphatidate phosphatase LPIN3 isoform X2 [Condylostylus longicornis]